MKQIKFSNCDEYFFIDDEDYDLVSIYKWRLHKKGYVVRDSLINENFIVKDVKLHRFLMGVVNDKNYVVDHINHNKRDNTRKNLRVCLESQNTKNRRKRVENSKYIGLSKTDIRWRAQFSFGGKIVKSKIYNDEHLASVVRDGAVRRYYGEFANLNHKNYTPNKAEASEIEDFINKIENYFNKIGSKLP